MLSDKVQELILLTWSNQVLPNSYPPLEKLDLPAMQEYIYTASEQLAARLQPILWRWMQPVTEAQVERWMQQLVPKSTAFCALITAGEIEGVEEVAEAGVSIALIYWADHAMDRGDRAMMEAIRRYAQPFLPPAERETLVDPPVPLVETRYYGLEQLQRTIERLADDGDAAIILRQAFADTLWREWDFVRLSRLYLQVKDREAFWKRYAERLAAHTVLMGALIYVTSIIYVLYRRRNPALPSLAEIYEVGTPIEMLNRQPALGIRIFDDWGDREIDRGEIAGWDVFSINLFNQAHPRYVEAVLRQGGVEGETLQALMSAIRQGDEEGMRRFSEIILEVIREAYRETYAKLPARYHLFLRLSQRVMEAGYVNIVGDRTLSA